MRNACDRAAGWGHVPHPHLGGCRSSAVAHGHHRRRRTDRWNRRPFKTLSRLPGNQLDIILLRTLIGVAGENVSHLLGLPLPLVRSGARHATRYLEAILCPPNGGRAEKLARVAKRTHPVLDA